MSMMTLQQAAKILGAKSTGSVNTKFDAVSTDTRNIKQGDLFVALRGPNFDGHKFLAQAREQGAVGAIVDHIVVDEPLPQIVVEDTRRALGKLAAAWRKNFTGTVIGVTGSNGKTTVKEMLASILEHQGTGQGGVLATDGNLNNDIGVPLMLLRIKPDVHRFAIIEMGANHVGEISYLTNLVHPDVAMITNAAAAHLEGFGSLDDVARAKGEIYQGLNENGVAVVNADDSYANYWRELIGDLKTVTFGLVPGADVCLGEGGAQWTWQGEGETSFQNRFSLQTPNGETQITLALAGKHNVTNAIAAATAAIAASVELSAVQQGLAAMRPVNGRLQPKRTPIGQLIINDSYNANPGSMNAAIDVLVQAPEKTIFVIGDMAELGADAKKLHGQIGERAKRKGINALYATGKLSKAVAQSFGEGAYWGETKQDLINKLKAELAKPEWAKAIVLVKGSRSAGMEQVVEALLEQRDEVKKAGGESC